MGIPHPRFSHSYKNYFSNLDDSGVPTRRTLLLTFHAQTAGFPQLRKGIPCATDRELQHLEFLRKCRNNIYIHIYWAHVSTALRLSTILIDVHERLYFHNLYAGVSCQNLDDSTGLSANMVRENPVVYPHRVPPQENILSAMFFDQ